MKTKIMEIIGDMIGREIAEQDASKSLSDLGADSIDVVEIEMEIEYEFDLESDPFKFFLKMDMTVEQVIAAIEAKRGAL